MLSVLRLSRRARPARSFFPLPSRPLSTARFAPSQDVRKLYRYIYVCIYIYTWYDACVRVRFFKYYFLAAIPIGRQPVRERSTKKKQRYYDGGKKWKNLTNTTTAPFYVGTRSVVIIIIVSTCGRNGKQPDRTTYKTTIIT